MINMTLAQREKIRAQAIHYEFQPAAPGQAPRAPLVLVHGLAASLYDWLDFSPALAAAGYPSYALDLPGHGESRASLPPGSDNPRALEQAFNNWLDGLQLDQPCVLVGHSLGGYLSLRYSLQNPARVRALVLCNPFYSLAQLPPLLRLNYQHSLLDTTVIGRTPEWLIRTFLELAGKFIRNGYELPEQVRRQTAADYKRARPEIFNLLRGIQDLAPLAGQISQPVLLAWGSHDLTLAPGSFTALAARLPDVRTLVIPGAGHVPHQSHAAEFNRAVLDFLAGLETGQQTHLNEGRRGH